MEKYFLNPTARRILIACHHGEDNARYADRIKTILWLDEGISFSEIAHRLFLDEKTPRRWAGIYFKSGIDALLSDNYTVYEGRLTDAQKALLYEYVDSQVFLEVGPIILYAQEEFNVTFSRSGMRDLLHRIGFTYKKASQTPGGANREKQRQFLDAFESLMAMKSPETPVLFMDATHPSYNSMPSYGWIAKGKRAEIPSNNTRRQQLNINGVLDAETHDTIMLDCERLNADSTIALLKKVEERYVQADQIFVITDNAGYYRAKPVREYVQQSRITLVHLPPYSPNLNLIERVWKFMHKHTVYNRHYSSFKEFREEILLFLFRLSEELKDSLSSLLTLNFQLAPKLDARLRTML